MVGLAQLMLFMLEASMLLYPAVVLQFVRFRQSLFMDTTMNILVVTFAGTSTG